MSDDDIINIKCPNCKAFFKHSPLGMICSECGYHLDETWDENFDRWWRKMKAEIESPYEFHLMYFYPNHPPSFSPIALTIFGDIPHPRNTAEARLLNPNFKFPKDKKKEK